MELLKMTTKEVREYLKNKHTVIIPVGATEEHSDALPLGTDTFTAEKIAIETGGKTKTIVAPTISVGNCHSVTYMFPGTISISPVTLTMVIKDYLESLYKHGFRNFLFVNGHGGNIAPIRCAIDSVVPIFKKSRFAVGSWWLFQELEELYDHAGHAGRGEVSMILYLHPDLVHKNLFTEEIRILPPYYVSEDLVKDRITKTGIINDTQNGNAKLGKILFEKSIKVYISILKKME